MSALLPAKLTHQIILFGLFGVVSVASFHLGSIQRQIAPNTPPTGSEVHLGKTEFTNPLLDYLPSDSTDQNIIDLKAKLETVVGDFKDRAAITELSIFYRDLETSEWFGINEQKRYSPASLMKVPLMVVYYKLAETNPGLLEETITYNGQYAEESNVPPSLMLAIDQQYTIDDLIQRMIVESDNIARSILSSYLEQRIEPATLNKLSKESEILIPADYEKLYQYTITAKDYSRIFRVLYNTSYLSDTMSEKALRLLAQSSYDSGIVNGIPAEIPVANKFGFSESHSPQVQPQFHDCGIVYTPNNPYVLCVMTKTTNITAAQEAISSVSQVMYEHLHGED